MQRVKHVLRQINSFCQYVVVKTFQAVIRTKRILFGQASKCKQGDSSAILVIRLDEIGDMVLMSPFLRELRRNYPSAHITLVIKPEVYNLVELCPYVNKILIFPRRGRRYSFYSNLWKAILFSYRYFRKKHYDLALVPRFDEDRGYGAGILAFLSSASRRIGYSEYVLPHKMLSDRGYDGFYTNVLLSPIPFVSHEVERNLDLLRFIGCSISNAELEVWTEERDLANVKNILGGSTVKSLKKVAVVLSAGRRNKEWGVSSYVYVIQKLAEKYPIQAVLLGAGDDAEKKGEIFCLHTPNTVNLINRTTLRESIEALKLCDYYLGGDTGLLHIAAALKMQGGALFVNRLEWRKDGIDTPDRFGPWNSEILILQPLKPLPGCEHGCNHKNPHCILGIHIEEVLRSLILLLDKTFYEKQ